MGNVGHTQNLTHVVRAFESSDKLAELGARFVIAGDGVAARDVRRSIVTDRVTITGVIPRHELEDYLRTAAVAVVSQEYKGLDFNVPSKLMNFMGYGLPVVAAVRPESEVARIVRESGAGWITTGSDPDELARKLGNALTDAQERSQRGERALAFAAREFAPGAIAEQFEEVLRSASGDAPRAGETPIPALVGVRCQ
jgi:colanic acid biosynthesis glycosyl transferase WcaI